MSEIDTHDNEDYSVWNILRDVGIPNHNIIKVEGRWPAICVLMEMPTGTLDRGLHGYFDHFIPTRNVLLHEKTSGRRRRKFHYRKGDIAFNDPGSSWSIEWTGLIEGVMFIFDQPMIEDFSNYVFEESYAALSWRTALSDYMPAIAYLSLDIASQIVTNLPMGQGAVDRQIETLLTLILRRYATTEARNTSEIGITSPQVLRAVNYINQNLCNDLTVPHICDIGVASQAQMNRLFRAELGQSVWQYVRKKRLKSVADELKNSSLAVARIAARHRFASRTTFSNQFKSEFGISPGKYREVVRQ